MHDVAVNCVRSKDAQKQLARTSLKWQFIKLAKLKPKFRSFKTEENEIKTHKIAAVVFWFVFLCLFSRFKARGSNVFKITVGLAQK